MTIDIRLCTAADLDVLQQIAYTTYRETFGPMNTEETMEKYLHAAFNKEHLRGELTNRRCTFYFLYADTHLAGYLKVNEAPAQTDINDPDSIEIERFYIKKEYQGKGLGGALMEHALRLVEKKKKRYVWLGVWEKNTAALSFYTTMGFQEAGRHTFRMGDEVQTDLIMKKVMAE